MKRLSVSINESDYNILRFHKINISALVRRELALVHREGLSHRIDIEGFDPCTSKKKHRLSVNILSDDPSDYYEEPYKLPFVIRCIISQYVENLRGHE